MLNQKPVFSFYSEAKVYSIGQDETNINELIKYYTQPHFSFSNKWLSIWIWNRKHL